MGKIRGAYKEDFPAGTTVRVVERIQLENFLQTWKLHNPLQPEQLAFAGVTTKVTKVYFYHGGYELYSLQDVPGIWHETGLREFSST